jgi:hypothetical protein
MIQQMENSLELGKSLIDTELDTGLLDFIIKPIVKKFYDYWAKNDARGGTLKQIKITLDSGKFLLLNGKSEETFNKLIDENFPKYLSADQTSRQCRKDHENYKRLKEMTKKTFINYLREVVKLLEIRDNVDNYGDLCRLAFPSRDKASQNLLKQLEYTDKAIKIVEEDLSMLKLPTGKKILIKALRKGFELTKKELITALNDTYEEK